MRGRAARWAGLAAMAAWVAVVAVAFQREHPIPWGVWRGVLDSADWAALIPTPGAVAMALGRIVGSMAIVLAAACAGRRLLHVLWPTHEHVEDALAGSERFWLSVICGLQLFCVVLIGLAATGLLYRPVLWAVVAASLASGWRHILPWVRGALTALRPRASEGLAVGIARVGSGVVVAASLPAALSPQVLHDSLVYHLALPQAYLDAHEFVRFPHLIFAQTPLNTEMLYTIALALGGAPTAKLLHLWCAVGMLALTVALGRRVHSAAAGILAAFVTLSVPLVLGQLATSYVDLAAGLGFTGAVCCVLLWALTGDAGPLRVGAVALGLFAGMRYTSLYGVAATLLAVLAVLAHRRHPVRQWVTTFGTLGVGLCVGAGPWLVKNAVHVGNPIFPLATEVFGLGPYSAAQHARMNLLVAEHGMGHGLMDLVLLPWRVTVHGNPGYGTFDGVITPLWLAALPAVILWRRPPARIGLVGIVALAYGLMWMFSTHVARYLIPVFPLFSLLAVCAAFRLLPEWADARRSRPWVLAGLLAAAGWWGPALIPTLLGVVAYGPAAWGRETADAYLDRTEQTARMYAYMEARLPADARVIGLWENRMLRCPRALEGDAVYEAPRWLDRFAQEEPDALARAFRAEGFTHVLLNVAHLERYPPRPASETDAALIATGLQRMQTFLHTACTEVFASRELYLYEIQPPGRMHEESDYGRSPTF